MQVLPRVEAVTPIGAVLSPMVALLRHRRKIEQRHLAWQRQIASGKAELARYDQAYTTCLRGRGYAVSGERSGWSITATETRIPYPAEVSWCPRACRRTARRNPWVWAGRRTW